MTEKKAIDLKVQDVVVKVKLSLMTDKSTAELVKGIVEKELGDDDKHED